MESCGAGPGVPKGGRGGGGGGAEGASGGAEGASGETPGVSRGTAKLGGGSVGKPICGAASRRAGGAAGNPGVPEPSPGGVRSGASSDESYS